MIQSTLTLAVFFLALNSFAQTTTAAPAAGAPAIKAPCQQIEEACKGAKFVKGEAKEGMGLWKDCINPIMQGTAQPQNAKLTLPTVDPTVIGACKAKHPNFGEGKGKKK